LGFGNGGAPLTWEFEGAGGKASVGLDTALAANSSLALNAAMLGGAGIALLPAYVVDEDLRRGAAVQVLPALRPTGFSGDRVYAVYLENRFLPPKVRVFIDYLLETIGPQQPPQQG
ncbi:MAG TPA: LysR family transcriptional regulator, partial [Massilia sp.]|nr:LysR family transcriptional regulator [Massilia sp.]